MKTMEAQVWKRETWLKQWGAKLDELAAKAEESGTETTVDYRKHIDDLKAKYQVAQSKVAELTVAGGENWETLKTGIERAWSDLESAFKKLTN